jgi:hypothetical protein
MNVTESILLDRAVLASIAVQHSKQTADSTSSFQLTSLLDHYGRLLYEPTGMSAIEGFIYSTQLVSENLVAIPREVSLQVDPAESQLLDATVEHARTLPSLLHAHQRYEKGKGGTSRAIEETMGYVIRLLLLARQYKADIFVWPLRTDLVMELFREAKIEGSIIELDKNLRLFRTGPCQFPYLPPREQHDSTNQFGIVFSIPEPTLQVSEDLVVEEPVNSRTEIFISYSRADRPWLTKIKTHLAPLVRKGHISTWADSDIDAGDKWREELERVLSRAKLAILLVTPSYLASDFIAEHELPPLLERAEKEGLKILWIAVSSSSYEETPISSYQAVNDPARPLDGLTQANRNKELVEISRRIKKAATA